MTFKTYIDNIKLQEDFEDKITMLLYLSENSEFLNESQSEQDINESIDDWLAKVGMKLHKGNGLVDYIVQFSKGAGKLILAAIKGDKEEVKKIAKSLDKSKVIDFLLKLDMATMHVVTGPIHFIDAVTGWDLMADIEGAAKKAESKIKVFKDAILKVKESINSLISGNKKNKLMAAANKIDKNIPS